MTIEGQCAVQTYCKGSCAARTTLTRFDTFAGSAAALAKIASVDQWSGAQSLCFTPEKCPECADAGYVQRRRTRVSFAVALPYSRSRHRKTSRP